MSPAPRHIPWLSPLSRGCAGSGHDLLGQRRRDGQAEIQADDSAATRASLTSQDSTFLGGDLNAKRLTVLVGPPAAPSRRGQQVPFLLTIPLTEFAAGLEGRNVADPKPAESGLDGAPGSTAHFKVTLPLARHPQRLIFTLREAASGTVLWGDAWVTL
jgi:hypothetical protein